MGLDSVSQAMWDEFSKNLKSKTSKKIYLHDIGEYIGITGKQIYMSTAQDVDAYYSKMSEKIIGQKITGSTVLRKFRALSRFAGECVRMDAYPREAVFQSNLFRGYLQYLKVYDQALEARVVPVEDVDKILSAASADPCLYAILAMVWRLGLKVPEICGLKKKDVHIYGPSDWTVDIFRRNEACEIRIPTDIRGAMLHYEADRGKRYAADSDSYFMTEIGKPYSMRRIEWLVKGLAEQADVPGCSLRDIRNSSASLMFAYGANPDEVGLQLGIQGQATLRCDTGLKKEDLAKQASEYVTLEVKF